MRQSAVVGTRKVAVPHVCDTRGILYDVVERTQLSDTGVQVLSNLMVVVYEEWLTKLILSSGYLKYDIRDDYVIHTE